MSKIEALTDKEVLALKQEPTEELTIIDFYSDWCNPCKLLAPTLEHFASLYKINKANVDTCTESVSSYGIRGIPTLVAIKNGNVLDTISGNQTKGDLQEWFKSVEDKAK